MMVKSKVVNQRRVKKKVKKEAKELTRLGAALRGLGSLGGSALGGLIGHSSAGSSIGRSLGASLSKWLGSGDYTVSSNSIVNRMDASGSIPAMHNNNQTIVVRHKEFLGEIVGSQSYTVQKTLNINPGLPETFPWFSTVASKFQEYKIRGLVFHYVPSSGNAVSSTNAALGTVMMQTSYRAGETAPSSKQEMLNEYWACESIPSTAFCHPIECDPKENPYNLHYVRSGTLPSTADQLLYDLGTLYVATSGMQADNVVVGDLWVTYEIELKKPVLVSSIADAARGYAAQVTDSSGSITGSTIFSGTLTLGNGNLNEKVSLSANTITLSSDIAGWFDVVIDIEAATTFSAATVTSTPSVSGCAAGNFTSTNVVARTVLGGTTPTLTRFFYCITVFKASTAAAATITVPEISLKGSAARTDVKIYQRASPFWL